MERRPFGIVLFDKGSKTFRIKRYRGRSEAVCDIESDVVPSECRDTLIRLALRYDEAAALDAAAVQ